MSYWNRVHTEQIEGFDIVLSVSDETIPLDDLLPDDTEEQIDELARMIDRGDLVFFCARVQAFKSGIELGTEYLGGCIYDSYDDFKNDPYYDDLVARAIEEAKSNLKNLLEDLQA